VVHGPERYNPAMSTRQTHRSWQALAALTLTTLAAWMADAGLSATSPQVTAASTSTTTREAGFVPLFDGISFAGWDGDTTGTWRIVDGALVGGSLEANVPHNEFLATTREFGDFVLKLQFKLVGTEGFINAGVQLRSQRVPGHYEMVGYQLDLGDPTWWGSLYDESRRDRVLAQSDMAVVNRVLRRGEWNDYEIRCEGRRIVAAINGTQTIDYTEPEESIPQRGRIALQVHGGGKVQVWYREIRVRPLS
jgi:hypothetical protein